MVTYEYDLDVTPGGVPVNVNLSQYDQDYELKFKLYSRHGFLDIRQGTTVGIRGTKKDGTGYSVDAVINGYEVTVSGDKQMTAVAGKQCFELKLLSGGKELNTANFFVVVERAAMDKDTVKSESVIKEFENAAELTEQLIKSSEKTRDDIAELAAAADTSASKASKCAASAAADADTAASSSVSAVAAAETAVSSSASAANDAKLSESWAKGGTGVRSGENTNNSQFFAGLAETLTAEAEKLLDQAQKVIVAATQGALIPGGTVTFENLPANPATGYMYNISNDFTTDSRFVEGAGVFYRAGANVYWTADGKWDVLVGTQVTGVKGAKETTYHVGNVSISAANVGAVATEDVDTALNATSVNPVQNKAVKNGIDALAAITWLLSGGTAIPANADLNDYTTPGTYYCDNTGTSETIKNKPFGASPFYLIVVVNNSRTFHIIRNLWASNMELARYLDGNTWTDWDMTGYKLLNNLTTATPGAGALDAYQGYLLNPLNPYISNSDVVTCIKDLISSGKKQGVILMINSTGLPPGFNSGVVNYLLPDGSNFVYLSFDDTYQNKYSGIFHLANSTVPVWKKITYSDNTKSLTDFTEIPSGADLKSDTYLVPGNYACIQDSTAKTLINCPLDMAFTLEVSYGNGMVNYIKQTFQEYRGKEIYIRTLEKPTNKWVGENGYLPANELFSYEDVQMNVASGNTDVPNVTDINLIPIILRASSGYSGLGVYYNYSAKKWTVTSNIAQNITIRFFKYPIQQN